MRKPALSPSKGRLREVGVPVYDALDAFLEDRRADVDQQAGRLIEEPQVC